MSPKTFFTRLCLISGVCLLGIALGNLHPPMEAHFVFSIVVLAVFVVFMLRAYAAGRKAAASEDKNAFTRLALLLIMFKLFGGILGVTAYATTFKPVDTLYLIPFFAMYLIFSIFEYDFLSKIGKQKP